jgi:hypothetical protein
MDRGRRDRGNDRLLRAIRRGKADKVASFSIQEAMKANLTDEAQRKELAGLFDAAMQRLDDQGSAS